MVSYLGAHMKNMTSNKRFLPIDHDLINSQQVNSQQGDTLAADDPRVAFARSVNTARAVIAEVDDNNAANESPCPDWNARLMAGHIIAVLERVAALPAGDDIMAMAVVRDDLAVDALSEALTSAAQAVHAAWTDDALAQMVTVPFGTMPGGAALAAYASEILTHTWDLATAIGVEPQWHVGDTEMAAGVIKMGLPAEPRAVEGMPFDPVVPTADDAPAIDRLVAWVGRNPNP